MVLGAYIEAGGDGRSGAEHRAPRLTLVSAFIFFFFFLVFFMLEFILFSRLHMPPCLFFTIQLKIN